MRTLLLLSIAFSLAGLPQTAHTEYLTPEEVIDLTPIADTIPRGQRAAEAQAAEQNKARLDRLYGRNASSAAAETVVIESEAAVHTAAPIEVPDANSYQVIEGTSDEVLMDLWDAMDLHGAAYDDRPPLTGTGPATVAAILSALIVGGAIVWRAYRMKAFTKNI
jgi:hypothetical protein